MYLANYSTQLDASPTSKTFQDMAWDRMVHNHPQFASRQLETGFQPHTAQIIAQMGNARFTALCAGRRGGKTIGIAPKLAHYCDPNYRDDTRRLGIRLDGDEQMIAWIVTPDRTNFQSTRRHFTNWLNKFDIPHHYSKTDFAWYLPNADNPKTIVYWKHAKDPDTMRGDGVHLSWWDEPAFIPNNQAWNSFQPALSDKSGHCWFSSTPSDQESNIWFYDEIILRAVGGVNSDGDKVEADPDFEYITWQTIENPHIPAKEIRDARRRMHHIDFEREYQAQWSAGGGKDLKAEWLHPYIEPKDYDVATWADLPRDRWFFYIGVDPAISLNKEADYFALRVIAVNNETGQAVGVDSYRDRIDFPTQLEIIEQYSKKWRPLYIGIEAVAYQNALVQMVGKMDLPSNIYAVQATKDKKIRLRAMSPLFRASRVRITKYEKDFIGEWISFPSGKHDDALDAMDIAIRTAMTMHPEIGEMAQTAQQADDLLARNSSALTRRLLFDSEDAEDYDAEDVYY